MGPWPVRRDSAVARIWHHESIAWSSARLPLIGGDEKGLVGSFGLAHVFWTCNPDGKHISSTDMLRLASWMGRLGNVYLQLLVSSILPKLDGIHACCGCPEGGQAAQRPGKLWGLTARRA